MSSDRQLVYAAIDRERSYQSGKWGGHSRSVQAWLLVIEEELREAKLGWVKTEDDTEAIREILQVAACAVACIEQHGIVEREANCGDH